MTRKRKRRAELYEKGVAAWERNHFWRAVEIWHRAAALGDLPAASRLWTAYRTGTGCQRDDRQAEHWLRVMEGRGYTTIPRDRNQIPPYLLRARFPATPSAEVRAWRWILAHKPAYGTEAAKHLALLYHEGIGVKANDRQAFRYFHLAALGNFHDQANLASAYWQGWGVKRDLVKAAYWYRKSIGWDLEDPPCDAFETAIRDALLRIEKEMMYEQCGRYKRVSYSTFMWEVGGIYNRKNLKRKTPGRKLAAPIFVVHK